MVGFTSSGPLVFQAAVMAGATPTEMSSWIFALGVSISAACIGLSLYYRMPILIGWSTPGAALLITSLAGVPMPEAIGAFIFAALLTIACGVTGLFEKMIIHVPRSLSAALVAGILLHFGLTIFTLMQNHVQLVSAMLVTYLIGKRVSPRTVILWVFLVGAWVAKMQGLFHLAPLGFELTAPVWMKPVFSPSTLLGVGLPLFIVTMTSQNIPGVAILESSGFRPPISSLISWVGASNLVFAPLGCYSISLTAFTAAICANEEADVNPALRYKSTLIAGLCWLMIGLFSATWVALFQAFPQALVLTLAGVALLSTLGSSLKNALQDEHQREPALITILGAASGVTFLGIGSAFWGLMAGIVASTLLNWEKDHVFSRWVATPSTEG